MIKAKMKISARLIVGLAVVFLYFSMLEFDKTNAQSADTAAPSREEMKKNFQPIDGKKRKMEWGPVISPKKSSAKSKDKYVTDEVLVKLKEEKISFKKFFAQKDGAAKLDKSSQGRTIQALAGKYGLEKKKNILESNVAVLKIKDGQSVAEKVEKLKKDPNVEYAQPNFKYYPATINPANDTLYTSQWGLNNTGQTVTVWDTDYEGTADADMDAPEGWAVSEGNSNIIAAVLDTGVAYDHPDLTANMWDGSGGCKDENNVAIGGGCPNHGWDYDNDDNDPAPGDSTNYYYYSHGTHVAGIIAATDNTQGILGVAPHTQVMAIKAAGLTTDILVEGVAFAKYNGARIINASFGGYEEDTAFKTAIQNFDGLFVAAAGNDGTDNDSRPMYPCADDLDNIICVAATDQDDEIAEWSNYGATTVDMGAPGANIISSIAESGVSEFFQGTADGSIPSGFTQTGGTGHEWQVGSAQADFGNSEFWKKVLFGDSSFPYADSANTTFGNSTAYDLSNSAAGDIFFYTACDTESDPRSSTWKDYMVLELSADGLNFYEVSRWDEDTLGGSGAVWGIYSAGYNVALFSSLYS
jgi:subtilisin family serine protease